MDSIIDAINNVLWSMPVVYLILAFGLLFSVLTRFCQLRLLPEMLTLMKENHGSAAGVSPFQSLCIAIGNRVGTGNIAGVITAIAFGGPGSVFWMWVVAFIGAASAFIESTLAQIYKVEHQGQYRGGPAFYIDKGIGSKWFARFFAVAAIISLAILLPQIQASTSAMAVESAFGINTHITGAIYTLLFGLVILGGIKGVAKASEVLVPIMAVGYLAIAFIVIIVNIQALPSVIKLIVSSAFSLDATFGGIVGSAIVWGVKRGIFSNEAGMGTASHCAGAAEASHPVQQGLLQSFSVYIDTLLVCSATAFLILTTDLYNVFAPNGDYLVQHIVNVDTGPIFAQKAVDSIFPGFGSIFIAFSLLFFTFTSIIAYFYIAETNLAYLTKGKTFNLGAKILKGLMIISTFYGATIPASKAWAISDLGIGVMVWINFIAILILVKPALIALKDYERQRKQGTALIFNPQRLGIKNADYWEQQHKEQNVKTTAEVEENGTRYYMV